MTSAQTNVTRSVLDALSVSSGYPLTMLASLPPRTRDAIAGAVSPDSDDVVRVEIAGECYLACRFHRAPAAVVVLGPCEIAGEREEHLTATLVAAAEALGQVEDERLQRLELATQLEVTSRSVLAITAELELEVVLRRIVDLAREIAGATYAALGVPTSQGEMHSFITSGMSAEDEARIPHRPRGEGLLGLLLREPRIIRLADLTQHPASAGFPEHHPRMTSFLGVPIISRGQTLGNLYLTEKRYAKEFTESDARLVELLARHAAVAIENARLYNTIEYEQSRLQLILDQLPEAIIYAEADPERVTLANRQTFELFGWSADLPMPIDEFFARNPRLTPQGTPVQLNQIAVIESLRTGAVVTRREINVVRPDGTQITILVNSAPVFGPDGRVKAAISVFQDITQIKDAEQLKDDFLSLVSHELRTPLTTIQGGSMLLLQMGDALDAEARQEILADMAGETRRLATLIENMVQLANIRAGRMVMDAEPLHVRRAVNRAIESERQNAPNRIFESAVEPDLFAVGDPGLLDQLLRNLIHNAVKYSPVTSPIVVTARRSPDDPGKIEVAVRDYGPGIAEEDLPFVFDRFHRNRAVVERGTPGMGLGLYLARHLAEAHEGDIWVERPEDGGTRFAFTIPAAEELDE